MILALGDRCSNRWEARFDRRHSCRCTGDIELLADSRLAPYSCQPQSLALIIQTPPHHREALLPSAQLEIVARHFRGDDDSDVFERSRVAFGVCSRCANRRAHSAEEIQLPESIESSAIRRSLDRLVGEAGDYLPPLVEGGIGGDDRVAVKRD